tara:strand:+ start:469 stop:930 length:462 start_codon:yes stop_codon:yes gene_type:complete
MKITIITICNKNNKLFEEITNRYTNLISKKYNLNFINIGFKATKNKKNLYVEEYKKALSYVDRNSILIALDENGLKLSSLQFAEKMTNWNESSADIFFIIGGPDGLTEYVTDKANVVISLSKMTFPHHLLKVILTEQIYRAMCIISNHPYHRQ